MRKCFASLSRVILLLALSIPTQVAAQKVIIEGGSGDNGSSSRPPVKLSIIPNSACLTSSGKAGKTTGGTDSKCIEDPNAYQGTLGGPLKPCPGNQYHSSKDGKCVSP
jgi:hypothetical protein